MYLRFEWVINHIRHKVHGFVAVGDGCLVVVTPASRHSHHPFNLVLMLPSWVNGK